jgi:hypothetical protein
VKLLVHGQTRKIHDALDTGEWNVPPAFDVYEVDGSVATYPWPNGSPTRCILEPDNVTISGDPEWVPDSEYTQWWQGRDDLRAVHEWARSHINQIRAKLDPPMGAVTKEEAEAEVVQIAKEIAQEAAPPSG